MKISKEDIKMIELILKEFSMMLQCPYRYS